MSQERTRTDQGGTEVQSLFANILQGCLFVILLLGILVITELTSRALGPFEWSFYLSVFIAFCVAVGVVTCKMPDYPEQTGGRNWLEPKTPDILQKGFSRLHGWFEDPRHRVKTFFLTATLITFLSQASQAIRASLGVDSNEPFVRVLAFMLVSFSLCVAAALLISLLARLFPENSGENR